MMYRYITKSLARGVHLGLGINCILLYLVLLSKGFFPILACSPLFVPVRDVGHKGEVSDLVKKNRDTLMSTFKDMLIKDLLKEAISNLKRANKDASAAQMNEIKKLNTTSRVSLRKKRTVQVQPQTSGNHDNIKTAAEKAQLEKVKAELECDFGARIPGYFQFCVLSQFDLSFALFIFTKILKPP